MQKIYLIIILFFLINTSFSQDIYNYNVVTLNDSIIHLSSYADKEVLIVNSSLSGKRTDQYLELENLKKQFAGNDLIIIVFPTQDFDSIPFSNSQVATLYDSLHLSYVMAKTISVKGSNQSDLYQWLTQSSKNGVIDSSVKGDFFKFLIDKSGHLKGVFSGKVKPLDTLLLNALK